MLNIRNIKVKKYAVLSAALLGFALPQGTARAESSSQPLPELGSLQSSVLDNRTAAGVGSVGNSISSSDSYILGPGDEVAVTVFGYEEYTESKIIAPDGTITMPIVGSLRLADQTPTSAANLITARLNEYLIDPRVTVDAVGLRPLSVTVAGQVQRPGPLQLQSLTTIADGLGDKITPS